MKRAKKAANWGLREIAVLCGGLLIVAIYLFWATRGFTARPEWFDAWELARMEAMK